MKKILTLLLAVAGFITVNAQSREESRRVILGGDGSNNGSNGRDVILGGDNRNDYPSYPGNYPTSGSRNAQIDQVNREYDAKINSIRNNSYLSYEEKQRAIRQLEKDRQARIKQINKGYDNGYYGKKGKGNNGKHKGWYKKEKNKNWKKGNRNRG